MKEPSPTPESHTELFEQMLEAGWITHLARDGKGQYSYRVTPKGKSAMNTLRDIYGDIIRHNEGKVLSGNAIVALYAHVFTTVRPK